MQSWGGKEAGFGLAACCQQSEITDFPETATTVHLEFAKGSGDSSTSINRWKSGDIWQVVHLENVHQMKGSPAEIHDEVVKEYQVPTEKQVKFSY